MTSREVSEQPTDDEIIKERLEEYLTGLTDLDIQIQNLGKAGEPHVDQAVSNAAQEIAEAKEACREAIEEVS